jgi:hypothetical protein
MKKLLTICLIMATVFTVNAQEKKPTKEETLFWLSNYANDLLPNLKAYGGNIYYSCRIEFNENNMKVHRETWNLDGSLYLKFVSIIEYKYIYLQETDKIEFKIERNYWGTTDSNDVGNISLSTVKNQVDLNGGKYSSIDLPYLEIKDIKGSKTDLLRVIKAIMNMAKLSGAPNIPQVTKSTF